MKMLMIMVLMLLLFACSNRSSDQAAAEIKNYLDQRLYNPASYLPVSFSELMTDTMERSQDPQYKVLIDSLGYWSKLSHDAADSDIINDKKRFVTGSHTFSPHVESLMDSEYVVRLRLQNFLNSYVRRPCGFRMTHILKEKNRSGAMISDTFVFRFDSSLKIKTVNRQ